MAIYNIDNINLDFQQFTKYNRKILNDLFIVNFFQCRVIKQSTVLISKAFKGQLVIPDFSAFIEDIQDIFERYVNYVKRKS